MKQTFSPSSKGSKYAKKDFFKEGSPFRNLPKDTILEIGKYLNPLFGSTGESWFLWEAAKNYQDIKLKVPLVYSVPVDVEGSDTFYTRKKGALTFTHNGNLLIVDNKKIRNIFQKEEQSDDFGGVFLDINNEDKLTGLLLKKEEKEKLYSLNIFDFETKKATQVDTAKSIPWAKFNGDLICYKRNSGWYPGYNDVYVRFINSLDRWGKLVEDGAATFDNERNLVYVSNNHKGIYQLSLQDYLKQVANDSEGPKHIKGNTRIAEGGKV